MAWEILVSKRVTSNLLNHVCPSFTSYFGVEATEANCKCLECRDWITVIHGKQILSHFAKLKDDILMFWPSWAIFLGSDQLEVFHWSNCNSSMEVQTPTLELLMPPWSLVSQYQSSFSLTGQGSWLKALNPLNTVWLWPEKQEWWKEICTVMIELSLCGSYSTRFNGSSRDGVHNAMHSPRTPAWYVKEF